MIESRLTLSELPLHTHTHTHNTKMYFFEFLFEVLARLADMFHGHVEPSVRAEFFSRRIAKYFLGSLDQNIILAVVAGEQGVVPNQHADKRPFRILVIIDALADQSTRPIK